MEDTEETKVKMTDEEILDKIQPDIDDAKSIQEELAEQRENYYKILRGYPYGNERAGWSSTVSPVVWTNHQGNLATMVEIFSDEFFVLKSDDNDRASKFQKLIKYQMFRKQDGYKRIYDFMFNAGYCHYGVFKVYYKEDYTLKTEKYETLTGEEMLMLAQDSKRQVTKYEEVESVDPMSGGPVVSYENVKVALKNVEFAGPCFDVIPPWEFGYSSDCRIGDWGGIDGRLVFHRVKRTLNDIRKKEKMGVYRKGTFEACKELGTSEAEMHEDQDIAESFVEFGKDDENVINPGNENPASDRDDLNREVSVRECYVKMDIDEDGLLEPCIVVIIEDKIIAQVEENPYKRPPFRIGGMLPEPHKVHGIAPPAILDNDQKITTNLTRFVQDMAAQICYRNPITSDHRMQQMLQNRKPFDVILGDPQKIGEVPVQPADSFILKALEMQKGDREEATGNSRYNQGTDSESLNKTATGITLIAQNAAKRGRMSAKLIGNGPITGLIRDFVFINQKWKSEDPIRILGTDIQVNPEDLDGEYDIEIDIGVSPGERQQIANQIDLLIQFGTQAGLQMGLMDPVHIMKAQKKKYGQLNINVDDLMVNEDEFMARQQQMKMQQQMAGPGGPPPGGPPPGQPPVK